MTFRTIKQKHFNHLKENICTSIPSTSHKILSSTTFVLSYTANTYYIFNLKIIVIIASNVQKKYFIKKNSTVKQYCATYNDNKQ